MDVSLLVLGLTSVAWLAYRLQLDLRSPRSEPLAPEGSVGTAIGSYRVWTMLGAMLAGLAIVWSSRRGLRQLVGELARWALAVSRAITWPSMVRSARRPVAQSWSA